MGDQATADTAAPTSEHHHHRPFGRAYWMLNSIEMFERLAYFGIRAVVPLYIMQATEPGGLHLSALHKGWIYMWWAIFQSFLPIVTGGFADRYGYKRVLTFAISMNIVGYIMMANLHSYYGFFASILVLATGTAFFKPSLQGSLAQNLTKANSSLGWGIFYWVVNVGAFGAPFMSTVILGKPHSLEGWQTLFLFCAGFTACNLLLLLTFKDVPSGASKTESPLQVLKKTVVNIVEPRLITWLLIMSCFWLMMYQLWDLHPNFITDWVNSSMIAAHVPVDAWWEYSDRGLKQVPQQILLNLNAGLIILLMVPLSWTARKMRTLSAMLVGMTVATGGILVAGLTGNGWVLLLGILFFSLGEMWTGPKKNEYLGLIAPPGKKGLYLGYVNIPIGIGVGLGSWIAGYVYNNWGEKATLALKELGSNSALVARAAKAADWSDSLEKIPAFLNIARDEAFEHACDHLGHDPDTAAESLRSRFRYDQGQIVNLGYQFLAFHPEYRDKVKSGLVAELREIADQLDPETAKEDKSSSAAEQMATQPASAPTTLPADLARRSETLKKIEQARVLLAVYELLDSGKPGTEGISIARYVDRMPEWLGEKRVVVLGLVRELVNPDGSETDALDDAEIIGMLWERFGGDPEVLNNLALEYLAQGTDQLRDAVAKLTFDDPVKEIEERIGIGRTKSFAALSAAMGAGDPGVEAELAKITVVSDDPHARLYAFLVSQPHLRFIAVAEKDWTRDVGLLRAMIESDAEARQTAETLLKEKQAERWERLKAWLAGLFGSDAGERDFYEQLAGYQDLVQKALEQKDWARTPEQAAQLLQLNPFEARARAAAEVNGSALKATQALWDEYHPQYKVWIPFACIGVVATIALGIFGQMAKRWKDMNA